MNRFFYALALCLAFCLAACGGPTQPGGGDDDPTPDATTGTQLDAAKCTAFAQSAVAAASTCGTPLPGGAQAQLEGFCKKGVAAVNAATMCGGNPKGGLDCFASPDPNDWVCAAGEPYPACNGDIASALGMYCLVALGNPACATGVKCQFDADCSGGLECNGATGQCFSKSAYCIGLPCQFDADCPNNEKCNNAEGVCVGA
jgi:hypothetical protein